MKGLRAASATEISVEPVTKRGSHNLCIITCAPTAYPAGDALSRSRECTCIYHASCSHSHLATGITRAFCHIITCAPTAYSAGDALTRAHVYICIVVLALPLNNNWL